MRTLLRPFPLLVAACGISAAVAACSKSDKEPEQQTPKVVPTGPVGPATATVNAAQRLTQRQYKNAIRDLFGAEVVVPAALEPDVPLDGFESIGASKSTISARGVEQYETAAFKIAAQVLEKPELRAKLVSCSPVGVDDPACAKTIFASTGRRVWRRPLQPAELDALAAVASKGAAALGTFDKGVELGLAALLQSPHFLYRPAVGEPDPENPGKKRYTGYELATRLSFFLWNSVPDDALLDAADAGKLGTYDGVKAEVDRMLASPKAREGFRGFVQEWLKLGGLDYLEKDAKLFTYYTPDLGPMAREETLRVFEDLVFDRDEDVRQVFTTRRTFVNPKLASMYQVMAPDPNGFAPVELPEDAPRRGLLGHVSILALYAHPTSSSATLRGKFVREQLLCATIPPPPVNVNTALPEPTEKAKTLRDRVKIHLEGDACRGCHQVMDPIGLGLENFDTVGRWRTNENGAPIDPSGVLDGVPFANAKELGQALHDHPSFGPCLTRKVFQYATGFTAGDADEPTITALAERFAAADHRVKVLIEAVATSPAFRALGELH